MNEIDLDSSEEDDDEDSSDASSSKKLEKDSYASDDSINDITNKSLDSGPSNL